MHLSSELMVKTASAVAIVRKQFSGSHLGDAREEGAPVAHVLLRWSRSHRQLTGKHLKWRSKSAGELKTTQPTRAFSVRWSQALAV